MAIRIREFRRQSRDPRFRLAVERAVGTDPACDNPADAPSLWFDMSTPAGFAALQAFLDPITGDGGTNYEDAIFDAQQSWTLPPNPADITNVYFISDGDPQNRSITGSTTAIPAAVAAARPDRPGKGRWEAFLARTKSITPTRSRSAPGSTT